MVSRTTRTKKGAKMMASKMRKKGLNVSYYKKKHGYGVCVTKK